MCLGDYLPHSYLSSALTQDVVPLAGNLEMACLFLQICRRDSIVVKDGRVQSSLELTTKETRRQNVRWNNLWPWDPLLVSVEQRYQMDFLVSKKSQFFFPTLQPMVLKHPHFFSFFLNWENVCIFSDTRTGSFMSCTKERHFAQQPWFSVSTSPFRITRLKGKPCCGLEKGFSTAWRRQRSCFSTLLKSHPQGKSPLSWEEVCLRSPWDLLSAF